MKKTFNLYLASWAILLILFNLIVFLFGGWTDPREYTPSFWVGYGFITCCFVGHLVCGIIAFQTKNLQKMFYRLPLFSVSWRGLIVSFFIGGICMLFSWLPYWIGMIGCAMTLVITAIAVIKASMAASIVSDIDDKIKMQTFFVKSLAADAENLMLRAQNDDIRRECKKVYEAVRYSDPMSHEMLASLESQITIRFSNLANAVHLNDGGSVKACAREIIILVDERNKKCRLLK